MPKTEKNVSPQGCGEKWTGRFQALLYWIDSRQLWWAGGLLLAAVMVPHIRLGEGSVFAVHDQLTNP